MKTCLIYTFSGTGNSLIVANFVAGYLKQKDIETTIFNVKEPISNVPDPNDYDYFGLSYPIHGFNTPLPFVKFLKKVVNSKVKNRPYFIIKNSGEPFAVNNASSARFVGLLKRKGYVPTLEHHFLMPYNIMFTYKENLRKQMYLYVKALTKVFADDIVSGKVMKIHYPFFYRLFAFFVRIEWIAGFANAPLMYVKKKICINCDKCIKGCPVNALYRNKKGKIKVHHNCCICMACSFNCPVDAFRMGFLNPWRVNFGGFQYDRLLKDESLDGKFVNRNTKGYFKLFRKYYHKQNEILKSRGYPLPVSYNEEDNLEELFNKNKNKSKKSDK